MIAVGFSPRFTPTGVPRHVVTLEHMQTASRQASLRDAPLRRREPWAEAHGYRHGLAPRGSPPSEASEGGERGALCAFKCWASRTLGLFYIVSVPTILRP